MPPGFHQRHRLSLGGIKKKGMSHMAKPQHWQKSKSGQAKPSVSLNLLKICLAVDTVLSGV